MLWTYILGTVVIEVLTVEGSSPISIHRCLRSVYIPDATDNSDSGFVVLRAVRTVVTGSTSADQPRQQSCIQKTRLMADSGWLPYHKWTVNGLWDWEASSFGNYQKPWIQRTVCKVGATNLLSNTKLPQKTRADLLQHCKKDGDTFLWRIITGDET